MKLFDYIYYKFGKFYEGEPSPDFYSIYALTLLSISALSILVNSIELLISKKIIDLNNDPFLVITVMVSVVGFFSLLYYWVYVKSGRNSRISFSGESRTSKIVGWIGIIVLIVVLFFSAIALYLIRISTFA